MDSMRTLAACALFAGAIFATQKQPAQKKAAENPPFVLPDNVEMKTDLVYARYGSRELHLDLYSPKNQRGPFPAIVWVHGGGWTSGDKTRFRRQAAVLASKGFVNACIEYRLAGEARFPAALQDSKASVRYLRANAAKYHINQAKIGAAGGSAGGHLVAMMGTTNGLARFEGDGGNSGYSSEVQAVVALYPATDLVSSGKRNPTGTSGGLYTFLGASYADKPELWADASPITHASKNAPPFLCMHGTEDRLVPFQQSVDLVNRLKAAGASAELFTAEKAGHGFANGPQWFQPAIERIERFFTATLR
jgi:pectinesterase